MPTTSLSLIQRLKQPVRENAAWERFVQLYSPLLYFWSSQMELTEDESLDVVQEVLLLLLDKLPEFEYDGRTFRGWLRTVLKNKCRDHLRRRGRDPQSMDCDKLNNIDGGNENDQSSDEEYQGLLVRQALRLMQTEFQTSTWQACWLTIAEGMSAREAARQLGISENAVFVARSRVLRRLRDEFSGLIE